jgi:ribosomal protein S18 acetylase RimI-like enzyme
MPADAIRIRTLGVSDLRDVARVHRAAFPDSALTSLGLEAVRRYYEWQLTGPHQVVALAATATDGLAGFCVGGSFRGALSGFLGKNRSFLAWRVVTHPWLVSNEIVRRRIGLGLSLLNRRRTQKPCPTPPAARQPSFGVLSLAVHPRSHGRQIGRLLMDATEIAARERGFTMMHLTVAPENRHAVGFYEHLHWDRVVPDGEWRGAMRKVLTGN